MTESEAKKAMFFFDPPLGGSLRTTKVIMASRKLRALIGSKLMIVGGTTNEPTVLWFYAEGDRTEYCAAYENFFIGVDRTIFGKPLLARLGKILGDHPFLKKFIGKPVLLTTYWACRPPVYEFKLREFGKPLLGPDGYFVIESQQI